MRAAKVQRNSNSFEQSSTAPFLSLFSCTTRKSLWEVGDLVQLANISELSDYEAKFDHIISDIFDIALTHIVHILRRRSCGSAGTNSLSTLLKKSSTLVTYYFWITYSLAAPCFGVPSNRASILRKSSSLFQYTPLARSTAPLHPSRVGMIPPTYPHTSEA